MPEGQFTSLTKNPEVLPDELLEDFEPRGTDPLGEGAFAVVRLLRRRKTGELFALKCIQKYPLQIRNMLSQMHREVRIHKALSHPNILQLVRVFDDPQYVFMLLEYCEKGPLRQIVAEAPNSRLAEPEAVFYFDQIVQGVEWMHRNSCVHRDLKLENMLLTAKDEIKICDFGWSAEVETDRLLKTVCGTTAYWPPELWESEPQDEAVDLWALGCLLYEMLASHAPFFSRGEKQDLGQQVVKVHFACPPWFSNEACHCVHCLLQREPTQRIRSKELRRHPWLRKHASAAAPVRSTRPSTRQAAPNEAPPPAPPAPPAPPPPRALATRSGRDAPEVGRAALPGPPVQAALPQGLQGPGKPVLLPAPKLAGEAGSPGGAPGFTATGVGPHVAGEATQALRPALRHGQPVPTDRRPGTVERRLAWDLPHNPRGPMLPGPALAGGPTLGPNSPGWEEALAAARAASEAGAAAAVREAGMPTTPGAREPGVAAVVPRSADFPRSPVSRATSMGGAVQQPALSPTRKRTTAPPTAARPSEPFGSSGPRYPGSADALKENSSTSPAHGRWPNGNAARTPVDAAARPKVPATQPGSSRFGSSVKVVANSVSPTRSQAGAGGYGPTVMPNNSPTSVRLPLPTAQSFPAHHIFASEAGCGTPLNSALIPGGKAQSFSVQSPTTSFFLQSMALPTSPATRSPPPHHSPTPHSPQHGQCGTPLAHSGSGSIAAAAARGGGGFLPQSGSVVVRHSPPPMQCNYYAGGLKQKVFLSFGGANDSFSYDTSVLSQAIAT